MARRLDEAFAGCDQWTPAPPAQRRSETVFSPVAVELLEDRRQRPGGAPQEPWGAVGVGVVQQDNVTGAVVAASSAGDRARRVAGRASRAPSVTSSGRQLLRARRGRGR